MKKISIVASCIAVVSAAVVSVNIARALSVGVQTQIGVGIGRADQEIDRRVAALKDLSTRVQAMAKVTADAKSKMAADVQAQVSDLNALKAKIDADTDASVLRTDVQSITASYRIFALVLPQGRILAAADRIETIVSSMKDLGTRMQARIAAEQSAGRDVSAMTSAMADFNTNISYANVQAQVAGTAVIGLKPDEGDQAKAAANHKALLEGRTAIKAGTEYLQKARKDIGTILQGLK